MVEIESTLLTLRAMLLQEDASYTISEFFRDLPKETSHGTPVDATARRQIAAWVVNIMDACNYKTEYAAITMSLLDRFVHSRDGRHVLLDRSEYQLAALAALYTSVKIHCPQALSPDLVAKLSQGAFTREDVERMEQKLLFALQFRVNPPTVMDFVRSYLCMVPSESLDNQSRAVLLDLASLQAEVSVLDATFISIKASHVAFGSLMNAIESTFLDNSDFCEDIMKIISLSTQINPSEVQDIQTHLYEAIMAQTSIDLPAAKKAVFHEPVNKRMRRESFKESPRSIFEHHELVEH
ncbi:cyclin-like protein [Nitzschia inconspicua]|uniref:Cyclin-like protein n=1 Tax=Nitzschia inconspicua TaxID=303405 RepID=A0A9K3L0R5_9STRA|nr:cyclin-like protein [Nitzschia inconspicua]